MKNRAFWLFLLLFLPFVFVAHHQAFLFRVEVFPNRATLQKSSDWRDQAAAISLPEDDRDGQKRYATWGDSRARLDFARRHPQNFVLGAWALSRHNVRSFYYTSPLLFAPQIQAERKPKTLLSAEQKRVLEKFLIVAREFGGRDAKNAFFDWREAQALLILGRESEAIAVLRRAAQKPFFENYWPEVVKIDRRRIWHRPDSAFAIHCALETLNEDEDSFRTSQWFANVVAIARHRKQHAKARAVALDLVRVVELKRANIKHGKPLFAWPSLNVLFPVVYADSVTVKNGQKRPKPNASVKAFRRFPNSLAFYAVEQRDFVLQKSAESLWEQAGEDFLVTTKSWNQEHEGLYRASIPSWKWQIALWPEWLAQNFFVFWRMAMSGFLAFWLWPSLPAREWRVGFWILIWAFGCWAALGFLQIALAQKSGLLYFWPYSIPLSQYLSFNLLFPPPFDSGLWFVLAWSAALLGTAISPPKTLRAATFLPFFWLRQLFDLFWSGAKFLLREARATSGSLRDSSAIEPLESARRTNIFRPILWPGTVAVFIFALGAAATPILRFLELLPPRSSVPFVTIALILCALYVLFWQLARLLALWRAAPEKRALGLRLRDYLQGGVCAWIVMLWLLFALDFAGQRAFQTAWRDVQTRGELAVFRENEARQ